MRQDVVVEILPDGRAALRLVILPPEPPHAQSGESESGVVEIPLYEEDTRDEGNVIVWQM